MGHSAAVWDCRAVVEIMRDWNGINYLTLRSPLGASARVGLHGGGQVTSWRNEQGEELLFTSSKAIFKSPTAVRGGISICFPQFGNCRALEQHGFAKNKMWAVDDNPPPIPSFDPIGKSFIDLVLKPSEDDLKAWPHSEVRIEGLETLDYLDNLCQREQFTEQGDAITSQSEVDRIHMSTPNVTAVLDHEKMRTYVLTKQGLPDTVIWIGILMLCMNGVAIKKPHHLEAGLGVDGTIGALGGAVELSFCSEHLDLQDGVGTPDSSCCK